MNTLAKLTGDNSWITRCTAGGHRSWRFPSKRPTQSKALRHPDIRTSATFRERKVPSIRRRNRPVDQHFVVLEHCPDIPLKIDVQQYALFVIGESRRPQALAIGRKIKASETRVGLDGHCSLGTIFQSMKCDAWILRYAAHFRGY